MKASYHLPPAAIRSSFVLIRIARRPWVMRLTCSVIPSVWLMPRLRPLGVGLSRRSSYYSWEAEGTLNIIELRIFFPFYGWRVMAVLFGVTSPPPPLAHIKYSIEYLCSGRTPSAYAATQLRLARRAICRDTQSDNQLSGLWRLLHPLLMNRPCNAALFLH